MGMFEKHKRMAQEVCEQIMRCFEISGIVLIGSLARGNAQSTSDVDLLVVAPSTPEMRRRKALIDHLKDPDCFVDCTDTPKPFGSFCRQGIGVDLLFYEDREIKRVLEHLRYGERIADSKLPASLQFGEILSDPHGKLAAWIQALHPIPPTYVDRIIPIIFADACSVIYDLHEIAHEESLFYLYSELLSVLTGVFELVFLANGRYYDKPHRIHQILQDFVVPPRFLPCIHEILRGDATPPNLQHKWRVTAELLKIVGDFLAAQQRYDLLDGWNELRNNAPFVFEKSVQQLSALPL